MGTSNYNPKSLTYFSHSTPRILRQPPQRQRRCGFSWNRNNYKKVCAPSSVLCMASNGYAGRANYRVQNNATSSKMYKRLGSCLVIPPPTGKKPRAIIKFLGGAFIGAVPEVTYSYLLRLLANEGYLVISVPYNVTFDHSQAAQEVFERFHSCLDIILTSGLPDNDIAAAELVDLPLYSVGHSNGALLQVLTGSYFSEKIPKASFRGSTLL